MAKKCLITQDLIEKKEKTSKDQNMNNRDVAIDIYNRLNRWSHGALTDFAVGIIEDELDMAFPECAENTEQLLQPDTSCRLL